VLSPGSRDGTGAGVAATGAAGLGTASGTRAAAAGPGLAGKTAGFRPPAHQRAPNSEKAPHRKPMKNVRRPRRPPSYLRIATGVPAATIPASSCASQFVRRMQPWDCVFPMVDGSGVPWMP
jgi:hypothetical protein